MKLLINLNKNHYKAIIIVLSIITIDQIVKILVHYNMALGGSGEIKVLGDWFKLHYVLNEGMAFGITLGKEYGKIMLTIMRWIAIIILSIYIYRMLLKSMSIFYISAFSLILGGAIGNVIDSTFYGVWLNNAKCSEGIKPLCPWFHGQVVDMFYFDIWEGIVSLWVPFIGGKYYSLWPIFNVADASIFIGVAILILFRSKLTKSYNEYKNKNI